MFNVQPTFGMSYTLRPQGRKPNGKKRKLRCVETPLSDAQSDRARGSKLHITVERPGKSTLTGKLIGSHAALAREKLPNKDQWFRDVIYSGQGNLKRVVMTLAQFTALDTLAQTEEKRLKKAAKPLKGKR
ncbi:MAG: hypothetical protein AB7P76_08385 [Candidatus Melainabacteria bacterium]